MQLVVRLEYHKVIELYGGDGMLQQKDTDKILDQNHYRRVDPLPLLVLVQRTFRQLYTDNSR